MNVRMLQMALDLLGRYGSVCIENCPGGNTLELGAELALTTKASEDQ